MRLTWCPKMGSTAEHGYGCFLIPHSRFSEKIRRFCVWWNFIRCSTPPYHPLDMLGSIYFSQKLLLSPCSYRRSLKGVLHAAEKFQRSMTGGGLSLASAVLRGGGVSSLLISSAIFHALFFMFLCSFISLLVRGGRRNVLLHALIE
jgi:hypothetical protein